MGIAGIERQPMQFESLGWFRVRTQVQLSKISFYFGDTEMHFTNSNNPKFRLRLPQSQLRAGMSHVLGEGVH